MTGFESETPVYQGQFGEFTITAEDRREVVIYRAGLALAGLSFVVGTGLLLWQGATPAVLLALTVLYGLFCAGLGISLWTIHIYLAPLHRALQVFWAIGAIASLVLALQSPAPLALTAYEQPLTLLGIGFVFAALTGIFVKEAFCFNRLETKILTPIVPLLLVGHLTGTMPFAVKQGFLVLWAALFLVFVARKATQAIPPDIGDKSVFAYLREQRQAAKQAS